MHALSEALIYSIRCCIHEHLAQDSDVDAAIDAAAREIVQAILRDIHPQPNERNDS